MSYEIDIDLRAHDDIAALPDSGLLPLAEAMTLLQLSPWSGRPINEDNPDGPVRTLAFGAGGMVTYLVLDDLRRVDILLVGWAGR